MKVLIPEIKPQYIDQFVCGNVVVPLDSEEKPIFDSPFLICQKESQYIQYVALPSGTLHKIAYNSQEIKSRLFVKVECELIIKGY